MFDSRSAGLMFIGIEVIMLLIGIATGVYAVMHGASLLAGAATVGVFVLIGVVLWVFILGAQP